MSVIMLGSVIAWPFYFLNTMPWQRLERAKRIRATRENLADPESAYYRIGEHQVYYLQDVHTIPEAQKQALAHLEPNKNALGYREVLEVKEEFSEKEGKKLRKYVLTDYKWLTLAQVDERISTLEKAFRSLGVKEHAVVLIYAETRIGKSTQECVCLAKWRLLFSSQNGSCAHTRSFALAPQLQPCTRPSVRKA